MKENLMGFLKPSHTSVSVKFIVSTFLVILFSGILIGIVYIWSIASIIDYNIIKEETILSSNTVAKFNNDIEKEYLALEVSYLNNNLDPSLSKYFDIGVIQVKDGRTSNLNFNDTKFAIFDTYIKGITPTTSHFVYDDQTGILYVNYFNGNNFEIGAIDTSGAYVTELLNSSYYYTMLVNNKGTIVASNSTKISDNYIKSLQINYDYYQQIKIGNIRREVFTYTPIQNTSLGFAILSYPVTTDIVNYLGNYSYYLILLGIVVFLAMITLFSVIVDIPLTRLITFFDDYKKGHVRQVRLNSDDTFGIISNNINDLIRKLTSDFKRIDQEDKIQDDFIKLSSHLLRTPLTSIQGYIDILKSKNTDSSIKPAITNIEMALNKLISIEENLLSISADNTEIINAKTEDANVSDMMQSAYDQMISRAMEKNLNFLLDLTNAQNAMLKVNKENIILAIKNLIDNGIKFTAESGTVKLYAMQKDGNIIISVSDTGIGLTKEEAEQIFKKFSKISDTMEYNTEGFGIGLYVVKLVAEQYNGKVWVDSIKGSGSIFNIMLPINKG